jgi:hypothetical protein
MSESKLVIAADSIVGDDETDTLLLRKMAEEAERYVRSFAWCLQVKEGFWADGIGGVVAIFLFRVDISKIGGDRWTWVFIGDLPSAYLEMDPDYRSPRDALARYIEGVEEWISAARSDLSLSALIPIESPTDTHTLNALSKRADTLREQILPHISGSKFYPSRQSSQ